MRTRIDADEVVELFPSYATRTPADDGWMAHVHGWIYEPEEDSPARERALSALLYALGGLGVAPDAVDPAIVRRRLWPFLADNERGERIEVSIGRSGLVLEPSRANGHFEGVLRVPDHEIASGSKATVSVEAGPAVDGRAFSGRVHLVPPRGVSVISDIDDTIKITEVLDRRAMLANTFTRPFRAVPGMAQCYRRWADAGVAFHYVSSSPWQLARELDAFRGREGIPSGSMHLKTFRATDATLFDLFRSGEETKPEQILPILDAFPERTFVLVGDSGEKDPEIYGRLARELPDRIRFVALRNAGGEHAGSERLRFAFAGVARSKWCLFDDPRDLASNPSLGLNLRPAAPAL